MTRANTSTRFYELVNYYTYYGGGGGGGFLKRILNFSRGKNNWKLEITGNYLYCQVGPRKYKDLLVGYTPMLPLQVTLEQKWHTLVVEC